MKRIRTEQTRPNDKFVITINEGFLLETQASTILLTATKALTITGLEWSLSFGEELGAPLSSWTGWWVITTRFKVNPQFIKTVNGEGLLKNEEGILASGTVYLAPRGQESIQGKTSWMRKMSQGDKLDFSVVGQTIGIATASVVGTISFFAIF